MKRSIKRWLAICPPCIVVFSLGIFFLPSETNAQTHEIKKDVFSFKLHDSYEPTVLHSESGRSIPVYSSGETFINVKDDARYPNAAKLADKMENSFLDLDSVYTKREVDSLDGMPVIHLIKTDKREEDPFIQHFYYFDDGVKTYEISLSGQQVNRQVMEKRFQVTKETFRFQEKPFNHQGIRITLPVIFSTHSTGFWSGAYSQDETTQIMILANHLAEVKYESKLKELDKKIKSLKANTLKKESITVAGNKATKYAFTYDAKFKSSSEPRSEYHYVIEHPLGGVFYIWYSAKPGAIDILDRKLDTAIRNLTFL